AATFLELRAAQIAQAGGFHYFAFDNRGVKTMQRTQSNIEIQDQRLHHSSSGVSGNPQDWVPHSYPTKTVKYYDAWGQIVLLTDDQARGNAKAMQVSDVLARPAITHP